MSKHILKLGEKELLLLWSTLAEETTRQEQQLVTRRILRKDGGVNQTRKYFSEYEQGLLDDFKRLCRIQDKLWAMYRPEDKP